MQVQPSQPSQQQRASAPAVMSVAPLPQLCDSASVLEMLAALQAIQPGLLSNLAALQALLASSDGASSYRVPGFASGCRDLRQGFAVHKYQHRCLGKQLDISSDPTLKAIRQYPASKVIDSPRFQSVLNELHAI